MTIKIKEDLTSCLRSFKGILPEHAPEFNKVISELESREEIRNVEEGKLKACYLLGLLFFQMPELISPENEKPLNKFSTKAQLDSVLEPASKKHSKGK